MTEGKQKELLDMVSAAEAEAKSARLKVAAAERARVKEKQEAEELGGEGEEAMAEVVDEGGEVEAVKSEEVPEQQV